MAVQINSKIVLIGTVGAMDGPDEDGIEAVLEGVVDGDVVEKPASALVDFGAEAGEVDIGAEAGDPNFLWQYQLF